MPRDILSEHQDGFSDALEHLRQDLQMLRTNRANPAMVEQVLVEAYGGMQPIVSLASITSMDARTLLIEPWDKSMLKPMETALTEARLGMNPTVNGTVIRMMLPVLTEESRIAMVKLLGEKLEAARISVRNVREEIKAEVTRFQKDGEISEDEKYVQLEQLDKTAAGWNEKIKHLGEEKEKEIMTI